MKKSSEYLPPEVELISVNSPSAILISSPGNSTDFGYDDEYILS